MALWWPLNGPHQRALHRFLPRLHLPVHPRSRLLAQDKDTTDPNRVGGPTNHLLEGLTTTIGRERVRAWLLGPGGCPHVQLQRQCHNLRMRTHSCPPAQLRAHTAVKLSTR